MERCLLKAAIVVDRFHAVQRVGNALDGVRLRLQREERKGLLYRRRAALLKDPAQLTDTEKARWRHG